MGEPTTIAVTTRTASETLELSTSLTATITTESRVQFATQVQNNIVTNAAEFGHSESRGIGVGFVALIALSLLFIGGILCLLVVYYLKRSGSLDGTQGTEPEKAKEEGFSEQKYSTINFAVPEEAVLVERSIRPLGRTDRTTDSAKKCYTIMQSRVQQEIQRNVVAFPTLTPSGYHSIGNQINSPNSSSSSISQTWNSLYSSLSRGTWKGLYAKITGDRKPHGDSTISGSLKLDTVGTTEYRLSRAEEVDGLSNPDSQPQSVQKLLDLFPAEGHRASYQFY
jgi:hypothetical protein